MLYIIVNNTKLLHQALENVNWDYVVRSFRGMDLQWYGSTKTPTRKELVADLTEIIQVTFENYETDETTQTVTPYWIVCIEESENKKKGLAIEIIFTPFVVHVDSKGNNKTVDVNIGKFKERLNIALRKENYELAAIIQEVLDEYESKE